MKLICLGLLLSLLIASIKCMENFKYENKTADSILDEKLSEKLQKALAALPIDKIPKELLNRQINKRDDK